MNRFSSIFKTSAAKFMTVFSVIMLMASVPLLADYDKPISPENLPGKAKTFIKENFPDRNVAFAQYEVDFMVKTYEAILTDGIKISFSRSGDWESIDAGRNSVPEVAVPEEIKGYILKNYPGMIVNEIERSSRDYEIKLSNGLEIKFDAKSFIVIEMDN